MCSKVHNMTVYVTYSAPEDFLHRPPESAEAPHDVEAQNHAREWVGDGFRALC